MSKYITLDEQVITWKRYTYSVPDDLTDEEIINWCKAGNWLDDKENCSCIDSEFISGCENHYDFTDFPTWEYYGENKQNPIDVW